MCNYPSYIAEHINDFKSDEEKERDKKNTDWMKENSYYEDERVK